jgi:YggT family protein
VGIVLRQFTLAVATILNSLLTLYFWILLAAAVLSWVNPDPNNPIVRFLRAVTDPVLYRVRRAMPFVYFSGIDFSPLVVMLGIQFVKMVVVQSLYELALRIAAAGASGLSLG